MLFTERTAAELLVLQAKGDATAGEITDSFLQAIRERDPKVKAFLHVDEASAREQARAIDEKRKRGMALGRARRRAGRDQGCALHQRHADHLRQQDARELRPAL